MRQIQLTAMEAGGEAATPVNPPPPPAPAESPDKASGGSRALAFVGFLILAFCCAVMAVAAADIGDTPRCNDRAGIEAKARENPGQQIECFDGGSTKKALTVGLMWPGAAFAGLAALLALVFTFTGRNGRRLMLVVALAIALSGLGILIGSL
jgi:hypothetical protein